MSLFQNPAFNETMQREGALVIPFLTTAELEELRAFYNEMHPNGALPNLQGSFDNTLFSPHLDYKLKIRDRLAEILQPATQRLFANYRAQCHIFMVKEKESTHPLHPHQDWSVVDETRYESFNVWIPLQDTTPQSGGLWVIKGSHKLNIPIRGGGVLLPDYTPLQPHLQELITWLPAKAGHAILFYHRTIHGSAANTTSAHRVVANFALLPAEAPTCIYVQKDAESDLLEYHPRPDFSYYQTFIGEDGMAQPPDEKVYATHAPYQIRVLDINEIEKLARQ